MLCRIPRPRVCELDVERGRIGHSICRGSARELKLAWQPSRFAIRYDTGARAGRRPRLDQYAILYSVLGSYRTVDWYGSGWCMRSSYSRAAVATNATADVIMNHVPRLERGRRRKVKKRTWCAIETLGVAGVGRG